MFVYKKGTSKSHQVWGVNVDYKNVPDDEAAELCKGEWFTDPRDCYKVVKEVNPIIPPKKIKAKQNVKKSDS